MARPCHPLQLQHMAALLLNNVQARQFCPSASTDARIVSRDQPIALPGARRSFERPLGGGLAVFGQRGQRQEGGGDQQQAGAVQWHGFAFAHGVPCSAGDGLAAAINHEGYAGMICLRGRIDDGASLPDRVAPSCTMSRTVLPLMW